MSRIKAAFKGDHKALIAYITVGYPDIDATPWISLWISEEPDTPYGCAAELPVQPTSAPGVEFARETAWSTLKALY